MTDRERNSNFLDFIPVHREGLPYTTAENGDITLERENTGTANRIAQRLFRRPRISFIHLDSMGSFLWPLMDGSRTVQDLAELVHEQYGEDAEPLYDRLVKYLQILSSYNFIRFTSRSGPDD